MKIGRMRIASRIPKATKTHSEYVIPIAFPLQQWLRERASVLRRTYITSLSSLLLLRGENFIPRAFVSSLYLVSAPYYIWMNMKY